MFEWKSPEPVKPTLDTEYLARLGGHLGTTAEMNRAARKGTAGQAVLEAAQARRLGAEAIEAMRRHLDGISGG